MYHAEEKKEEEVVDPIDSKRRRLNEDGNDTTGSGKVDALTNEIYRSSMLPDEKEKILQLVREKDELNVREKNEMRVDNEREKEEMRANSGRLLREKERENVELKREVNRLKWRGRLNGQLAYDMITSDDVWRVILSLV